MKATEVPKLQLEVSHTLSNEQLKQISDSVLETVLEAVTSARNASKVDSDILTTKASLQKWLGVSAIYLEELLADQNFPRGRMLSERKQVFFKSDIIKYLKSK
ncbi:hypothetical protein P7E05_13320 [Enterococcus gallinarum]|uniref:hypothetical protein n=1 Tax=Enterococcus gallinarum TaxID=1353 RepID=UPI00288D4A62|nr:hypothetical protein [Enterococcus gallinarum]MDT2709555.1 hypothetical protein [Enterococcus gallinarum]MDT2718518.1 hypothetical protein [Enterococcus gallinarum]